MRRIKGTVTAKTLLLVTVAALGALTATGLPGSAAAVDPTDCSTYPEKRVMLESQAWVDNQPDTVRDAFGVPHALNGPHAGQQGHIHVATCYPLRQKLGATGTVSFDVKAQLHNVDGVPWQLEVLPYINSTDGPRQTVALPNGIADWACTPNRVDCVRWIHVDFDLSKVDRSGFGNIGLWLNVDEPYDLEYRYMRNWRNYNDWDVEFVNGKPPGGQPLHDVGGQGWLAPSVTNGSEYAAGRLAAGSMPWDPVTGQFVPVSGIWRPSVVFWSGWESSVRSGKVMVDPALHAVPPSEGTVVFDGGCPAGSPCEQTLAIDTTLLANGMHRLLIMGTTSHTAGLVVNGQRPRTSGGVVIPFLVQNATAPPPPPPPPPTTTTTTTTEPDPCVHPTIPRPRL